MTRALTLCSVVGCTAPALPGQARCDQHRPRRGRPWQRLREAVLQRDHRRCTICGAPANEVHHLKPMVLGGTELPPLDQLETRCSTHNPRGPGLT
jgi:5-methylcytosine-specific restriction endonuclease McrA